LFAPLSFKNNFNKLEHVYLKMKVKNKELSKKY